MVLQVLLNKYQLGTKQNLADGNYDYNRLYRKRERGGPRLGNRPFASLPYPYGPRTGGASINHKDLQHSNVLANRPRSPQCAYGFKASARTDFASAFAKECPPIALKLHEPDSAHELQLHLALQGIWDASWGRIGRPDNLKEPVVGFRV